jgi:hypothetical protein
MPPMDYEIEISNHNLASTKFGAKILPIKLTCMMHEAHMHEATWNFIFFSFQVFCCKDLATMDVHRFEHCNIVVVFSLDL